MRRSWIGIVTLGTAAGACAAQLDNDDGRPMTRQETCTATTCERQRQECRTNAEHRCDTCLAACEDPTAGEDAPDCFRTCLESCDSGPCYDAWCNDSCAERSFAFQPSPDVDPAVLDSCLRGLERDRRCGQETAPVDCDRLSRVLRADIASTWDCRAAVPCDRSAATCYSELLPGNLGEETCGVIDTTCGVECDPGLRAELDQTTSWWRDDVLAALRTCFSEPVCDDLIRCLEAWHTATSGA
ncbi:MAG: hypothetical protein HY905_10390 [Deltaproteobacteria bacterium]|nr:hypothetical protein [Deltaproteobacteria bacterium]